MKKFYFLSVILFCCAWSLQAQNKQVVLAAENSWPPFAKADGFGLSRAIIEQAYALVGYDVEFVVVPYARALRMAEIGQVDGAFNVTKQASTLKTFRFGEQPILQARASYFYPPQSNLNFTKVQDITEGTSLALIIGYEYGNAYETRRNQFVEVRLVKQQQIIQMLRANKVNAAIMFDDVAKFTIDNMPSSPISIRKGAVNHTSDIFVAFSKRRPGTMEKMKALDSGLLRLRQQVSNSKAEPISLDH